jgi:hypothetical protein
MTIDAVSLGWGLGVAPERLRYTIHPDVNDAPNVDEVIGQFDVSEGMLLREELSSAPGSRFTAPVWRSTAPVKIGPRADVWIVAWLTDGPASTPTSYAVNPEYVPNGGLLQSSDGLVWEPFRGGDGSDSANPVRGIAYVLF